MQTDRELQEDRPLPGRLKDGEAIRFQDGHGSELILWMVMDCLYARLPPRLILFVQLAPVALHLTPRSRAYLEKPGPSPTVLESPWWSRPGPITVRSEVISTAPSGCTQGERRGGGQKRSVAWDSERGRGIRSCVVVFKRNAGKMALKLLRGNLWE